MHLHKLKSNTFNEAGGDKVQIKKVDNKNEKRYVEFISNENLWECLIYLREGYKLAYSRKGVEDFLKNNIDSIKLIFDNFALNESPNEWIKQELKRQSDRTISNYIGNFNEMLISKINDYVQLENGQSVDVMSPSEKIGLEIKNKHNTAKGSDRVVIFNNLLKAIEDPNSPIEECYYVRINDNDSQMKPWVFTHKGKVYQHDRIFIASADTFLAKITGRPEAFKELLIGLIEANKDYNKMQEANLSNEQDIFSNLQGGEYTQLNEEDFINQLLSDNHKEYIGFNQS